MNSLFHGTSLELVKVKIGGYEYLSIISEPTENIKCFLGQDDKVVFFSSDENLKTFLSDKESCNFSSLDEFKNLQKKAKQGKLKVPQDVDVTDFDKCAKFLEEFSFPEILMSEESIDIEITLKYLLNCILTLRRKDLVHYFYHGMSRRGWKSSLAFLTGLTLVQNLQSRGFRRKLKNYSPRTGYNVYCLLIGQVVLNSIVYK